MKRKKWTPREDSGEVETNRDKRKWQIALRRYLIEQKPSTYYAPFFGLNIHLFRQWIESQFQTDLNWENFGELWQLEHLVPAQYFDLSKEDDQKLYWNFLNIRVEILNENETRLDILSAISHFENLFLQTSLPIAENMRIKLLSIAQKQEVNPSVYSFLKNHISEIANIASFDSDLMLRLNEGEKIEDLILEREILSKFGS